MIDDNSFYFMHIPKTAGTSTLKFFQNCFPAETLCPFRMWDELVSAKDEELQHWTVFMGHFGGMLPLWLRAWPRTTTILRSPIARTLSHIMNVRREKGHPLHELASNLSIAEYCCHPVLARSVENLQSRYIASLSWSLALFRDRHKTAGKYGEISVAVEDALHSLHRGPDLYRYAVDALENMTAVGITESFEKTLRLFSAALELPPPTQEYRINVGSDTSGHGLEITREDYAAMESVTEIDRAVYDRGYQLFQSACATYGINDPD